MKKEYRYLKEKTNEGLRNKVEEMRKSGWMILYKGALDSASYNLGFYCIMMRELK